MALAAGPFLKFCGNEAGRWVVSVLVVTDSAGPQFVFAVDGQPEQSVQGQLLYQFQRSNFWVCRFAVLQVEKVQIVTYRVECGGASEGSSWIVPAAGSMPTMAYGSCAGFHSARDAQRYGAARHERWQHLLQRHRALLQGKREHPEERPYSLLLLGGDQVYADSIWTDRKEASAFVEWNDAGQNPATKFGALMQNQAERFYLGLYLRRWTEKGPAEVLASIPTVMMWDDHDIFDGWGSFPSLKHECAVYQGIFGTAAKYFRLFQQHSLSLAGVPGRLSGLVPEHQQHSFGFDFGSLAIVAPDLRGSRTDRRILGRQNLTAVLDWVDGLDAAGRAVVPRQLLVMTSLPVVYPSFALLEAGLGVVPGAQDLEDDVRDHWTSRPHREERLRLVHRLLSFSRRTGCQVTFLSGDVHVGAVSTITQSGGSQPGVVQMTQLISSAIVNAPPPASALFFLNRVLSHQESLDEGIRGAMSTFQNASETFVPRRNWLSLEPDERGRIWAKLFVEQQLDPLLRVIPAGGGV
jgi:hypothetical protein